MVRLALLCLVCCGPALAATIARPAPEAATPKAATAKAVVPKVGVPKAAAAKAAAAKPSASSPAASQASAAAPRHPRAAAPRVQPTVKPPASVAPPPAALPAAASATEPLHGTNTGLPLPRFASLKTDEVNFRTGPGTRYPIDWVYRRRDLPVQIEREFEVWRLIADPDGVKGWVHQATLTGRRNFVVTASERIVRADPSDTAAAVARLKPGVVGRLRACEAAAPWCQVQVGDYHGWLRRDAFWGIMPGEAIQ